MARRSTGAPIDPSRLDELLGRARHDVDTGRLPSCQLAVAIDGEVVVDETFGAPTGSRYLLFSVTKALVAAAVWCQIGEGDLDRHTPIRRFLPRLADAPIGRVTVEHLLTHTAGFPDAPLGPPEWSTSGGRLDRMATWRLDWEPGTACRYHAGSAHWVLAELLARGRDQDHRQVVNTRVCDPLGLPGLRLGVEPSAQGDIRPPVACGEPPDPEEWASAGFAVEAPPDVSDHLLRRLGEPEELALGVPGGGGVGRAADVALLYQAMLDDRQGLWDPTVLADGTRHVLVDLPDATIGGVAANRTLGLVLAGEDGLGALRGLCSTGSALVFGHPGAGGQIAFADHETGLSFCYLTDGIDRDLLREGRRRVGLANRAGLLCEPSPAED